MEHGGTNRPGAVQRLTEKKGESIIRGRYAGYETYERDFDMGRRGLAETRNEQMGLKIALQAKIEFDAKKTATDMAEQLVPVLKAVMDAMKQQIRDESKQRMAGARRSRIPAGSRSNTHCTCAVRR